MKTAKSSLGTLGIFLVTSALCVVITGAFAAQTLARKGARAREIESPIFFERTAGVLGPVQYSAHTASFDVFLSRKEADVVLHAEIAPSRELTRGKITVVNAYASVLRMRFVNANLPTSIAPVAFRRARSSKHSYAAVAYRGIYAGTDVILRGNQRRIGFQVMLSPGADADHIVLQFAGATSLELNARGDAVIHAGRQSLVLERPIAGMQGRARSLLGAYEIESPSRLRFIIPPLSQPSSAAFAD